MIKLAEQNAAGRTTFGMGTRYGRGRWPSTFCSAAKATGANAYIIAVAPVMTVTSELQLLNGPNATHPIIDAIRIEIHGTPLPLVLVKAPGISRSSPKA